MAQRPPSRMVPIAAATALAAVYVGIPGDLGSSGPYYHRCADARAAGATPLRRGEPGYRKSLDADGDGIACEPYR